jgi:hypothetical protein
MIEEVYSCVDLPKIRHEKMASYLHHTATTVYPCCVPTLGDSTGAGCVGLAAAKIRPFTASARNFSNHFTFFETHFHPEIFSAAPPTFPKK